MTMVMVIVPPDRERFLPLKVQLQELGLQPTEVDAVMLNENPRNLPAQAALAYYGREHVPGEVGCALSHLKAYRLLLNSDAGHALVLEDDARLVDPTTLVRILDDLADLLDTDEPVVISLYTRQATVKRVPGARGYRCFHPPTHAVAYAINRAAAHDLMKANATLQFRADWPLGGKTRFYLWYTLPFAHGDDDTRSLIWRDSQGSVTPPLSMRMGIAARVTYALYFYSGLHLLRHWTAFRNPTKWVRWAFWPRMISALARFAGRTTQHNQIGIRAL